MIEKKIKINIHLSGEEKYKQILRVQSKMYVTFLFISRHLQKYIVLTGLLTSDIL